MRAALKGAAGSNLGILGVTVLTSMDDTDLKDAGYGRKAKSLVAMRAGLAREIGVAGVVCSPHEAGLVRGVLGPKLSIVTPGVRPAGAPLGDQKRAATPAVALEAGATHLVVGRPITAADDPLVAARNVLAEMSAVRQVA
jgi:orotidine-5'-phosphate decarboxylase